MGRSKRSESGVALLFSLFALFLLTAIAVGMIYMTNTETSINSNFRNDQALYFAAKGGVEEARNRLMLANANSLFPPKCTAGVTGCLANTAVVPSAGNNGILYILGGPNPTTAAVQFWNNPSTYSDNDLCHDGYTSLGITAQTSDVPCYGPLPGGNGWFATTKSIAPFASTPGALPFQWVRIAQKVNSTAQPYSVNGSAPATAAVCYDGAEEVVLPATLSDCSKMPSMTPPNSAANPVYVITALAANSITGARRMLQAEVALAPAPPFPYGLFATGTMCGAVTLGGGAKTDSYTTADGGTYTTTVTPTGGDVGSNGNVTAGGSSTQIGGSIGVPQATVGACPGHGLTLSGGAGMVTNPQNQLTPIAAYTFPPPPLPNPLPPTDTYTAGSTMLPGTYGNVVVSSGTNLVLSGGTYNINSLTLNGNATITVTGPVVINVAGVGQNTPVDLTGSGSGNTFSNTTGIPNNFQINYGGTGTIKISGGSQAAIIVNAPAADIMLKGGSDVYGALVGATINDSGGVNFHYDRNTKFGPPNNGPYTELAFRALMY